LKQLAIKLVTLYMSNHNDFELLTDNFLRVICTKLHCASQERCLVCLGYHLTKPCLLRVVMSKTACYCTQTYFLEQDYNAPSIYVLCHAHLTGRHIDARPLIFHIAVL